MPSFRFLLTHLLRGVTAGGSQHLRKNLFLLTHLLRGVTKRTMKKRWRERISTHTPLARCDYKYGKIYCTATISTHTPLARCDRTDSKTQMEYLISTHTPLARCDKTDYKYIIKYLISTHTPLARCDKEYRAEMIELCNFYSHTSCEV